MVNERLLEAKAEAKRLFKDFPEFAGVGIGDNRVRVYFKTEEKVPQNATLNGVMLEFIVIDDIIALEDEESS